MCWGIPGKVVEVSGMYAKVSVGGALIDAVLGVDDVAVGDYVMVHAGLVVGKLSREEFVESLLTLMELQVMSYVDGGLSEDEARRKVLEDFKEVLESLNVDLSGWGSR
ncbi:MAG: HypC/HybG/HupF family hydrogenase formation chaperone [Sulfolobales archaeon]|nr:HypC/HybG/HupF family hydrogenase formation chaperone [Sulfolobales archaeon]MCX8186889.1 HypC/HybG/HupF family hydrogenase formation chaperone [Sulfolobales archaeon]MDW7970149.1 HypC/HybG/HupF family hydrogenase formation chaperone [Sulfolobales archaeon]